MDVVQKLIERGYRPPTDNTPIKFGGRVVSEQELSSLVNGRRSPPVYTMTLDPFKDGSPHNRSVSARMLSPVEQLQLPKLREPEPAVLEADEIFGQAALKVATKSPPKHKFDGWTEVNMPSISGVKSMNIAKLEQDRPLNLPGLRPDPLPEQNGLHQRKNEQYLPPRIPSLTRETVPVMQSPAPKQEVVSRRSSPLPPQGPAAGILEFNPYKEEVKVPVQMPVPHTVPDPVRAAEQVDPSPVKQESHLPFRVPPRRFTRRRTEETAQKQKPEQGETVLRSQYKRPNYASMTKEEQGLYHAELDNNYFDLCRRFSNLQWQPMPANLDLDAKHSYYERSLIRGFLSNKAEKYKFFFIIGCLIVQLFLTKICGIKAQDFAAEQYRIMNRYDRYIFEIVKRQNRSVGEEWSPEWSMIFAVGMSLLLHIGANYLRSWFGDSVVNFIMVLAEDLLVGPDEQPVIQGAAQVPAPPQREARYGPAADLVGRAGNYMAGGAQDANNGGLMGIFSSLMDLARGVPDPAHRPPAQQVPNGNDDPPFLE